MPTAVRLATFLLAVSAALAVAPGTPRAETLRERLQEWRAERQADRRPEADPRARISTPGDYAYLIESGGIQREYRVHVPAGYDPAKPEMTASTIPQLVAAIKAKGNVNYSSGGIGSPGHLAGEMFRIRTGVQAQHVPYKGAPPAILAVVTGETVFMFATASSAIGQVKGQKVKAVAVTTQERIAELPDVPTVAQAGLADFDVSDWVGFVLPKGTPAATRDRLHAALVAAFADPVAHERLVKATFVPAAKPLGPDAFAAFLRAEVAKWEKVVREANIRAN